MVQMEPHLGVKRSSMKNNHLLYHADIGKVKKITFSTAGIEKVFGYSPPHDPEGAREVMQHWMLFRPNTAEKTGPDYRAMNKHAAICGLTRADQQQPFRFAHPQTLARGIATHKPPPPLPSDANPWHTYGSPSTYRSHEQIRIAGRDDPKVKQLIQGSFQWDWVHAHSAHAHAGTCVHAVTKHPTTRSTKAAEGHAAAATRIKGDSNINNNNGAGGSSLESFKLSKFKRVAARTNTFRQPAMDAAATVQSVC